MVDSLRIRLNDSRERQIDRLMDATGERTKAGAVDEAIAFYLQLAAVDHGSRVGQLDELMRTAAERGSLTAPEIAAIVDTPQVPVSADTTYSVGSE